MTYWDDELPARASQSQVRAGVFAVIENCMINQARPRGGFVENISEFTPLKHFFC